MAEAARLDLPTLVAEFRHAMGDCEELYRTCGEEYAQRHPELALETAEEFTERLVDLHRGLVLKVFVEIAQADRRWSEEELLLAEELFDHLWQQRLEGEKLREALSSVIDQSNLRWDALVGPFERLSSLREHAGELQTLVLRLASLVARADPYGGAAKARQVHWIQRELQRVLTRVPLAASIPSDVKPSNDRLAMQERPPLDSPPLKGGDARGGSPTSRKQRILRQADVEMEILEAKPAESPEQLALLLVELDELIGLDNIKQEVRELTNFLQIQKERAKHGLPETNISLHSIFSGNPGTGKTTIARIYGRILGALGILAKAHLIETDRSGLVAEFAGQTAPKTQKRVDEALDGVLFIDEAYSLVAEEGDDPYGAEAVQTLLKRMEDNRDRLVVILAGYPEPMEKLLRTNPGLSSRFPRLFNFPDYTAGELGRIFHLMCQQNHYELPGPTRVKLLLGFQHLLDHRDEHFGNGRLARNIFELAIRKLANRITGIPKLTRELLTTLQPEDIAMKGVPPSVWADLDSEKRCFQVTCPGCKQTSRLPQSFLSQQVQCRRCKHEFTADWGEVIVED